MLLGALMRFMHLSAAACFALALSLVGDASPASVDDELPVDVDIVDLTRIEWEPGKPLPVWVQELNGRRVRIGGYMHVTTEDDVSAFMLVGDSCVCAGTPPPNHFVDVSLVEGETRRRPGMIDVIGIMSVGELEEDGYVKSLFRMRADVLE